MQEMSKKTRASPSPLPKKTRLQSSLYLDRRKETRDDETGGDEVLTLLGGEATVKGTADEQRHSDDACKHKVTHGRQRQVWICDKHLFGPRTGESGESA